ncbi:MAG TPA: CDP-alcohol phosphatidyltransferase family protein [Flavobacteriales bacterium]|nr:CDP-alcohol phosphatidyltransferase family protein [Flavobacteriales bacterium]
MYKIVAFIPNLFTLGNLFCGCLAIIFAFNWRLDWAAYMVFLAAALDFFDGFLARILKVSGELGKQLDSLADMVSFGVVPGVVIFQWLRYTAGIESLLVENGIGLWGLNRLLETHYYVPWHCYLALSIPVFSCYRLAKFNIDTRQSHGFIGLPTPANALFFCSLFLIGNMWAMDPLTDSALDIPPTHGWQYEKNDEKESNIEISANGLEAQGGSPILYIRNFTLKEQLSALVFFLLIKKYFVIAVVLIFSFLLVSPLPLFALKFKNFTWNDNKIRYIFLTMAVALLIVFQLIAIPFVVLLYILVSIVNNILKITV